MFKLPKIQQVLEMLSDYIFSSPLRRRIVKGLGANAFGQVVNIIIQLVSVPIFLHFWSADLYGKWLIVSSIPGYLSMSDIGFSSAAGNEMTMLTARRDFQAAARIFQSAWVFVTGICLIIGLLVVALAYLLPFDIWFNLKPLPRTQVSLVICLLSAYTLVLQQGGLIDAAFRSDGRYAEGTALANVVRFMEMFLTLFSVAIGGQLETAAAILLVSRILGTSWMWLMFKRANQWLSLGYTQACWQTIAMMSKPAIAFMVFPMGQALTIQGMTLAVGGILGPVAVVVLTTTRTVTRIVLQFITLINCAFWPELSSAFGSGDLLLARKLYQKASTFSFWLAVAISFVLVVAGPWLLLTWTGRHIQLDLPLFYLMLLLVISGSIWQSSSVVLMATNTHGSLAKVFLLGSVASLILALVLLKTIGIVAVPIALLLIDILTGIYATKKVLVVLQEKLSDYLRSLFNLKTVLN